MCADITILGKGFVLSSAVETATEVIALPQRSSMLHRVGNIYLTVSTTESCTLIEEYNCDCLEKFVGNLPDNRDSNALVGP